MSEIAFGPPAPAAWNYYANWAVLAILGRLRESDAIIKRYMSQVYAVAHYLQQIAPPPVLPLYRGIFLEPEEVRDGCVEPDFRYGSVSFTEDKDVACWFADSGSSVSGFIVQLRPAAEGYVVTYTPSGRDILFHYSWRQMPGTPWGTVDLVALAQMHPQAAAQANQIAWALDTQREVIVKPVGRALDLVRRAAAGCLDTTALEARLGPTWRVDL